MIDTAPTMVEIENRTLFDIVPLHAIFVDESYGRSLDASNLRRILRQWDPKAIGAVLLSLRPDGRYAVIDGQHRVEAARKMGELSIPARVYLDLSHSDEARLYRLFGIHKAQTPLDRFRAAVAERQPTAMKIKEIVEGMGLEIGTGYMADGRIIAIAAVISVYERYGGAMLDLALRTLYAAFGRNASAYSVQMVVGLTAFIVRYEPYCDWTRLVRRLQEEGLTEIGQRYMAAKRAFSGGNARDVGMGRVIHDIYNKRAQNKLIPWEDRISPAANQRTAIIAPQIRLSQRKALADVPKIWTGSPIGTDADD